MEITLDGGVTAGELATLTKRRQKARVKRVAKVPCAPLHTLMSAAGFMHATFLSLDVEGGEAKVLSNARPADFDLVMVETVPGDAARLASNDAVRALLDAAGLRTWPAAASEAVEGPHQIVTASAGPRKMLR